MYIYIYIIYIYIHTRIYVLATRALDSPACGLRLPPTLPFTCLLGKLSDSAYLSLSVRISWSTTSCMQRPKARDRQADRHAEKKTDPSVAAET